MTDVVEGLQNFCRSMEMLAVEPLREAMDAKAKFQVLSDEKDILEERSRTAARQSHQVVDDPQDTFKKVQIDLVTKQQQLEAARCTYSCKLNAIDTRCRVDMLLGLSCVLEAHRKFFSDGELEFSEVPALESSHVYSIAAKLRSLSESEEIRQQQEMSTFLECPSSPMTSAVDVRGVMDREGYLFKLTSHGVWKKRWFVVASGQIEYSKHTETRFTTSLLHCGVRDISESSTNVPFCFELIAPPPNRSLMLQASSADDKTLWMAVITHNISFAIEHITQLSSLNASHTNHLSQSETKREQLAQISRTPGNNACADCGSLEPEWTSINLGICVCIECSGIHRSIGAHVSKVRSLLLDELEPSTIQILKTIGNEQFNSFFECALPPQRTKPTAESSRAERDAWIRDKYINKLFFEPSEPAPVEEFMALCESAEPSVLLQNIFQLGSEALGNPQYQVGLHVAVAANNVTNVDLLVLNGFSVNAVIPETLNIPLLSAITVTGDTPLHIACAKDFVNIVALLVKRGGDTTVANVQKQFAFDVAVSDVTRQLLTSRSRQTTTSIPTSPIGRLSLDLGSSSLNVASTNGNSGIGGGGNATSSGGSGIRLIFPISRSPRRRVDTSGSTTSSNVPVNVSASIASAAASGISSTTPLSSIMGHTFTTSGTVVGGTSKKLRTASSCGSLLEEENISVAPSTSSITSSATTSASATQSPRRIQQLPKLLFNRLTSRTSAAAGATGGIFNSGVSSPHQTVSPGRDSNPSATTPKSNHDIIDGDSSGDDDDDTTTVDGSSLTVVGEKVPGMNQQINSSDDDDAEPLVVMGAIAESSVVISGRGRGVAISTHTENVREWE
eukprot:c3022_g1_i1.p1 GENE.c3022_g1_i1~~c3022_g1_i1.p1  ORF type:complete len:880 (-),score=234.01 c3022_g1_i1:138-2672(-)